MGGASLTLWGYYRAKRVEKAMTNSNRSSKKDRYRMRLSLPFLRLLHISHLLLLHLPLLVIRIRALTVRQWHHHSWCKDRCKDSNRAFKHLWGNSDSSHSRTRGPCRSKVYSMDSKCLCRSNAHNMTHRYRRISLHRMIWRNWCSEGK